MINKNKFTIKILLLSVLPIFILFIFLQILQITNSNSLSLTIILIIILLIVLLLATFFALRETKQIRLINDGIKNIKKRNFEDPIEIVSSDDLGDLAQTFNEMTTEIQKTYQELEDHATGLEEKVKERTREIENKNRQLEELVVRDHLTGLYNRTKLDEVLEYVYKRSKRYNTVFGVIMIDIDFFKKVNDTHGHQVGDTVLCEFANLLEENSRETDTVGRWGGEEFLIIVENIDKDAILKLAEKLRANVDAYEFSIVKHKTASFGVTIYRSEDEINKIVARADIALYKAKHNGRNRVEFL
jgi:diguanylate cyclase (GGDEF)-like protein